MEIDGNGKKSGNGNRNGSGNEGKNAIPINSLRVSDEVSEK